MSEIRGIHADDIDEFWPMLEDLIRKPLERTKAINDYLPSDILNLIKERKMQCWIAHNGKEILAVGITEILVTPRRRILGLPFIGAKDGSIGEWFKHLDVMKEYARDNGCKAIRGWGRKGWEKMLKPDMVRIEFDLELNDENIH